MTDQKAALEAAHGSPLYLAKCGMGLYELSKEQQRIVFAALIERMEPVEQVHRYANQLAVLLARKFPAVDAWKPLDDVLGLLTQIDNTASGFIDQRDSARERISSLEAALAVAREASAGWQTIDSAPKDGTPVMLFSPPDGRPFSATNVDGGLVWVSGGWGRACLDPNSWRGQTGKTEPSHWMPLPEPPKALAALEGK